MKTADSTDLRILQDMLRNSRRTAVSIASRLGLSRNTVQTRLNRLEEAGAFNPMDHQVNPAYLGFPLTAFMQVAVEQRQLTTIAQAFAEIPEVIEAHGLAGSPDLLIRVVALDADDLFRIHGRMLSCPGVQRIDTSLAIREIIPRRVEPLIDSLNN